MQGQTIMDHNLSYNEQTLSMAQNASLCVTTVLVCRNTLIHNGISSILSGTRFVICEEPLEQTSEMPILCLIHVDQAADELSETVERLRAQWPAARVVLLTEHLEPSAMVQALQAGLDGLCSTAMSREALVKALEVVMLGETFISSALAFRLLNEADCRQQTSLNGAAVSMSGAGSAAAAPANKLSKREIQILRYLTHGASNKHIARELGLTEATVKVHIKAILRKVKAANRTQAAMWAQQHMNLAADGVVIAAE
jgi:two-component system nitrate/nitrite response regulator NarL